MVSANLVRRLMTAAVAIPSLVVSCASYPVAYKVLGMVFSLASVWELLDLTGQAVRDADAGQFARNRLVTVGAGAAIMTSCIVGSGLAVLVLTTIFVLLALFARHLWAYAPAVGKRGDDGEVRLSPAQVRHNHAVLQQLAFNLFALTYVALPMSVYFVMRDAEPYGAGLNIMALTCSFAGDAAGYFVGGRFGRTRLFPVISPKKTAEGLVANFVFTVLCTSAYAGIEAHLPALGQYMGLPPLSIAEQLLLGAMISTVGQLGDICASYVKRVVGAKDSGVFFPGHGGALDRLDALIFSGPVTFLFAVAVLGIRAP